MEQREAPSDSKRVMSDDLTVYHDDDYILAVLNGGPDDGRQVRISVQNGLTMSEGRAVLPQDLWLAGYPQGSGYRAWTIVGGKAHYRYYESDEERAAPL